MPSSAKESKKPKKAKSKSKAESKPVSKLSREERYLNRELSWLSFNHRVLDEALDPAKPLLERVKFLAISASNLDEFFMVRVGGLQLLAAQGRRDRDLANLTPTQQLRAIRARTQEMVQNQASLWLNQLRPALEEEGIILRKVSSLRGQQREHMKQTFEQNLLPLLTPIALDLEEDSSAELASSIPNLRIAIAAELAGEGKGEGEGKGKGESRFGLVALPASLPRFVSIPYTEGDEFVLLEDLVVSFLSTLFLGEEVLAHAVFRPTRNGDLSLHDETSLDLAEDMEELLQARSTSETVRLEIQHGASRPVVAMLQKLFAIPSRDLVRSPALLDLKSLFTLASLAGYDQLRSEPWPQVDHPDFERSRSLFEQISEGDLFLHHPYQRFEPVVRLVEEAANDPDVLAIKQILYRTSSDSRIVDALIRAAQQGKQVTVLVELKARFDEARNLARAEELSRAGAQIIYGVRGLKTHAKICLVLRNEGGRIVRYCHFGTGNYNESTAKLYTDVSLLTKRPELGENASSFFNAVAGRCRIPRFSHLFAAPVSLKPRLLELIQSEAQAAKAGTKALLRAKVNSLQDQEIIDALYQASQAGVKIELLVRGICCLRPGIKGLSENIRVHSIIDRYLEHSRIIHAWQGGKNLYYISSADWMKRNLDKRIELMVPIEDRKARASLDEILTLGLADTAQAAQWTSEGTLERLRENQPKKSELLRSQEELSIRAHRAANARRRARQGSFEPHLPVEKK